MMVSSSGRVERSSVDTGVDTNLPIFKVAECVEHSIKILSPHESQRAVDGDATSKTSNYYAIGTHP